MTNFEIILSRVTAEKFMASLDQINSENFELSTISDNLIECLALLNFNQQHSLINKADKFIKISIDTNALQLQLELIQQSIKENELICEYILRGAPRDLMRRLFGMHAQEFSRRRASLGLSGSAWGRPAKREEETDIAIWKHWEKYENIEEKVRFLKLSKQLELDLHIIWSSLREYLK